MGSGASTPVYPHKIIPPSNNNRQPVARPLKPKYRSTFEDSIEVAQQERSYRTPQRLAALTNANTPRSQAVVLKKTPGKTIQNTTILLGSNDGSSNLRVTGPKEVLSSSGNYNSGTAMSRYTTSTSNNRYYGDPPSRMRSGYINDDGEYVLKTVSEYVLQDNGTYKLQKQNNCLIKSTSDFLRYPEGIAHPFAPAQSRQSYSSDEILNYRNSKNAGTRYNSSGYSSMSSTGTRSYIKNHEPTGIMLNKVVKVLESQPPQFLMVPEKAPPQRSYSPTPTLTSTVGVNTMTVPPNSGDRSKSMKLKHHNSSPDLYEDKNRTVQPVRSIASSPSRTKDRRLEEEEEPESPKIVIKPSRYAGGFHSRCANKSADDDRTKDLFATPERPPHLTPSPYRSRERRKSTGSNLSVTPQHGRSSSLSTTSSRSSKNREIKINSFGLVYTPGSWSSSTA